MISDTTSLYHARVFVLFLALSCVSTDFGGGDDACLDWKMSDGRIMVGVKRRVKKEGGEERCTE